MEIMGFVNTFCIANKNNIKNNRQFKAASLDVARKPENLWKLFISTNSYVDDLS